MCADFLMWLSVLCVEGPDGYRGHEAWTSKEVNIRDQQAALHRLAAWPQACKALTCTAQSRRSGKCCVLAAACSQIPTHAAEYSQIVMCGLCNCVCVCVHVCALGESGRLAVSPRSESVLPGSGAERVWKHWLHLGHQPGGSARDWHH